MRISQGSSVVLYASKELHHMQYSLFPDWPGGVYGTPTMAGSRPGALIAVRLMPRHRAAVRRVASTP
jgi:hypothetical protein